VVDVYYTWIDPIRCRVYIWKEVRVMKRFFNVMTVTSVLIAFISMLLYVGSQFPDLAHWYGIVALVSLVALGTAGIAEWVYDKGIKDGGKDEQQMDEG